MYLQCVLGQFGPVAEVNVIVRWPGLLGSISGSPADVNYVHMSNINHLLTNVERGISRLSADTDITRTPDARDTSRSTDKHQTIPNRCIEDDGQRG